MNTLCIHIPGDIPNLEEILDPMYHDPDTVAIYRDGDSYREWGERRRDEDPEHIVIQVYADMAEIIAEDLAKAGVPVDVTLTHDWAARVVWGLHNRSGWSDRYPNA